MKELFHEADNLQNENKKYWPLNTIYFYLTGDCNLACRHCWISPRFQKTSVSSQSLDYKLIPSIIAEAKPLGLSGVKLTGGEPLIHPSIREILKLISREDLNLVIETNGVAITREIADLIRYTKNPFVSVSLDGAVADIHDWIRGVPGSYEKTVKGIGLLVESGIRPQLIMTLMRKNVDQIKDVIDLAEQLGASSVKFNILQPTERGKALHEQGMNLPIEELVRIGSWIENLARKGSAPRLIYGHPIAFRPLNRLFGQEGSCTICAIHHIIGVLSDGSYALCGIGQNVPEMVFGNARTDHLSDIWENHPILNEIREKIPRDLKGICRECAMKNLCLGCCAAQNFYSERDFMGSFWYCESAYQKGLFPVSRLKPVSQDGYQ